MLINAEGEVITVYVADIADFQFVAASVFKREVAGWKRLLFISGTGDDADAVYIDFDGIVCCKGEPAGNFIRIGKIMRLWNERGFHPYRISLEREFSVRLCQNPVELDQV